MVIEPKSTAIKNFFFRFEKIIYSNLKETSIIQPVTTQQIKHPLPKYVIVLTSDNIFFWNIPVSIILSFNTIYYAMQHLQLIFK